MSFTLKKATKHSVEIVKIQSVVETVESWQYQDCVLLDFGTFKHVIKRKDANKFAKWILKGFNRKPHKLDKFVSKRKK